MVETVYYSALHWAKKAEASARRAEQGAQAPGRIVQIGFDGAMEDGALVFKHAPSGVEVPYGLLDDFEYELDLGYAELESLSSSTPMYIKNGSDTVEFVSALHRDSTTHATVGDMSAVMRYNDVTGYRWLFKAAYKITPAGTKVLLLYPVVANIDDKLQVVNELPEVIKENVFYFIKE